LLGGAKSNRADEEATGRDGRVGRYGIETDGDCVFTGERDLRNEQILIQEEDDEG